MNVFFFFCDTDTITFGSQQNTFCLWIIDRLQAPPPPPPRAESRPFNFSQSSVSERAERGLGSLFFPSFPFDSFAFSRIDVVVCCCCRCCVLFPLYLLPSPSCRALPSPYSRLFWWVFFLVEKIKTCEQSWEKDEHTIEFLTRGICCGNCPLSALLSLFLGINLRARRLKRGKQIPHNLAIGTTKKITQKFSVLNLYTLYNEVAYSFYKYWQTGNKLDNNNGLFCTKN